MSSSSDIEKLFDHFGGDANAYQEIGRENEARSARTRWPLLVTLDLTQPTIPAIGQRRETGPQALANDAQPAVGRQDTTPKDVASVTRAKAPLFTRSHRRDIPPVVAAAPAAAAASGAARFGALETKDEAAPVAASAAAPSQAAPNSAPTQVAPATAVPPSLQVASLPSAIPLRTPTTQTIASASPRWTQALAPAPAHAYTTAPAAPSQPASILGKLFAPEPEPAPPQAAAAGGESAPLQSVFDRLRGTPPQTAGASHTATSNSWLVNGPRRS